MGSVFRAVLLLGHVEVRNVVWRTCLSVGGQPKDAQAARTLHQLWEHSFATSRVAYALAKSLALPSPDEIATAALLHDVGKSISFTLWPDLSGQVYDRPRFSDQEAHKREESRLPMAHGRLGAHLSRLWALPRETCWAVEHHHLPSFYRPEDVPGNHSFIACVHLADLLPHLSAAHLSGDDIPVIYLPTTGWLEALGVKGGIDTLCTAAVARALVHPTAEYCASAEAA